MKTSYESGFTSSVSLGCKWDPEGVHANKSKKWNQKLKCFLAHILFTAKQDKSVNFALPTKGRRTRLMNSLPTQAVNRGEVVWS